MKISKLKFVLMLTAFLMGSYLLNNNQTVAQTPPEILLTWKSSNYAPQAYPGKIIPINKSFVSASATLIDRERVINLSRNEIRWFFSGRLLESGIGVTKIDFEIPSNVSSNKELRVEIINYRGGNIEKSILLPITKPEIIIDIPTPYSKKTISADINILKATPYFFNISKSNQLSFTWSANNQKAGGTAENPHILELDLSGGLGEVINLSVQALNNTDALEFAGHSVNLEIK